MFVRIILTAFLTTVLAWSVLTRVSEGAGAGQPYRVHAGDTLWTIASQHYGGDLRQGVWAIQRENDLADAQLTPGQILLLP
ncbi:MAG: LysM peptidoglycan-binding domain-containing protein [Actinobacteria bacterium]|nr:LysM peptidoglycan-binding domain-containing protein [Actinomycetota bacterium]